jgi:DNA-binding beta-propeller fold protein YncE
MRRVALGVALLLATTLFAPGAEKVADLRLTQTISLAGVKGRIDHLAFDPQHERLFVCALGNDSVEVIDLRGGKRVHSISGLGSPQGIAYVPKPERLYVANDQGGIVKIYDSESFRPLGEVNLRDDADNIRYDESANRIYVGFGEGGIAIINAAEGKQIGAIKLSAHPEAFELETKGPRIFVNLPNRRQVAVSDRDKAAVVNSWSPGSALANFPMSLDEANHRLMVGCRSPSKLIVLNSDSGDLVAELGISGDPDDLFYDRKRDCIYAICGAGKIDVINQVEANSYKVSATIETAAGARTGLFVPERDTLFVAVPHHGAHEAEIRAYRVE